MFLKLFRSQYVFQIIIFLLISLVLWIDAFITPVVMPMPDPVTPLYSLFHSWLEDLIFIPVVIAFLIIVFEGFYLNKILTDNKLIPRNTVLPAFIFIILISFNPENLTLNPIILSLVFLIPAISNILNAYDKSIAYTEIFNAALLISIASFFYFPAIGYLLFVFIGLYVFRIFKWREWIIPFIGFILPYLFLFVFYFIFDEHKIYFVKYLFFFNHNIGLNFILNDNVNVYIIILSVAIALILLISLFNIISKMNEKVISQRKYLTLILNLFLISLFTFIYRDAYISLQKMLYIFPLTFIFGIYFSNVKRTFINELIFTLLVVIILAGKIYL